MLMGSARMALDKLKVASRAFLLSVPCARSLVDLGILEILEPRSTRTQDVWLSMSEDPKDAGIPVAESVSGPLLLVLLLE